VRIPPPASFVLGMHDHPSQQHFLNLYKTGWRTLILPVHSVPPVAISNCPTVLPARRFFHDAAIAPLGPPCVDVVATAKMESASGPGAGRDGRI